MDALNVKPVAENFPFMLFYKKVAINIDEKWNESPQPEEVENRRGRGRNGGYKLSMVCLQIGRTCCKLERGFVKMQ
uniref:Long chain acyl-CoA synthetase 7 n=1 Tax=Rhizophora mucronata TaxID=61149 RepID=A0A2P2JA47_RHIMU